MEKASSETYLQYMQGWCYAGPVLLLCIVFDVKAFKHLGHSMTGFVYKHLPLGAVPIAHNEIMALTVPIQNFSIKELGILQRIVEKFGDFSTKEIVEYMYEERAYRETEENEIIQFREGDWVRDL